MHFKTFASFFLLGGAIAGVAMEESVRAPMDGSAIAKFLGDLTRSFNSLDKLVLGISKDNVKDQMEKIVREAGKINTMLNKDAGSIKASKPIGGIGDIFPLISVVGPLIGSLNKTITHVIDKRPIINEAKLDQKVHEGLMASEPGIVSLLIALSGQIVLPAPKSTAAADGSTATARPRPKMPKLTEENVKPAVDKLIDGIVGVFNGTVDLGQVFAQLGKGRGKGKGKGGPVPLPDGAASTMTTPTAPVPEPPAAAPMTSDTAPAAAFTPARAMPKQMKGGHKHGGRR
jgi:hypothetical protein